MKEADESLVGRTIAGKFDLLEVLGKGAMGCVYRARQISLDKLVAIKLLHSDLATDTTFAARFKREAKAASKLDHPNSIRILDFGEDTGGLLFIAMELVEGRSLLRLLADEWPLGPERIVGVLVQALGALGAAHDAGIVHRDMKPENILVTSSVDDEGGPVDVVKVCDFGIAKLNDSRAYASEAGPSNTGPLTRSGTLVGTPEYMSPEQGRGDPLDARSDLYSVGVILYQMLTGRVPFEAESAIGIILKHITDPPEDPLAINPAADPRLAAIALKAMSKPRDERFASAREMRGALRGLLDGSQPMIPVGAATHRGVPTGPLLPSVTSTVAGVASGGARSPSSQPAAHEIAHAATEAELEMAMPTGAPRWKYAVALLLIIGVGGGAFAVQQGTRGAAPTAKPEPSRGEPPLAILEAEDPLSPLIFPTTTDGGKAAPRRGPVAIAPTSARGAASAVASTSLPGAAVAVASRIEPQLGPPSPPPPPPATVAPAASPYVMGRSWVEIGAVNARGMRQRDVRQAILTQRLQLGACYRTSLAAVQSHATGIAVVNFSFDDQGRAGSAVVSQTDFLPEMTRCLQQALSRTTVPAGSVESGGGTSDAQLIFRNEP